LELSSAKDAAAALPQGAWLLYGAYGYTGQLIARRAVEAGARPVLAGRDEARTRALAEELGLEHRVFALDDPAEVAGHLAGVGAVVNAAGPFSQTWQPMVEACLRARVHYLDVTGEIDVLEAIFALDERAKQARVVLLPAVGFDVVPTDCAAARVARRIAHPTELSIAFTAGGPVSRGTARTVLERLRRPGCVRRSGALVDVAPGSLRRRVPFSDAPRACVAIPWGDVVTAYHSTGVGNVTVYTTAPAWALRLSRPLGAALSLGPVRRWVERRIDRRGPGPDAETRAATGSRVWAEARNAQGHIATVELTTPNGYALTADAACAAVSRLLSYAYDGPAAGALTPSRAFGDWFVESLEGVTWIQS